MSFLGPVTTLDGHLVRPHDLEIETHPFADAYPGRIERFNRVGFEVRLEVRLTEDDDAPPVLVTLTRAEATAKRWTWVCRCGSRRWPTPRRSVSRHLRRAQAPTASTFHPRLGAATHVH